MDSVGAYEAKTQLSKLLDRVMKGERTHDHQARDSRGGPSARRSR